MIVKNEQEVLDRCLNSVKDFVDEIIIVDTGSSDTTKMVAKKYTDKIFDFEWCNDFSKARNYAIQFATGEYIMWLDADDVVPQKTINYLLSIKDNMCADVYMLKYDIAFWNNKPIFSYYRERIIKNCSLCKFVGAVHECIVPFGKVEKLDCCVQHHRITFIKNTRNLDIYQNIKKQRPLLPREQYYYARELFDHKKYAQSLSEFKKFVKNKNSWVENVIDAYYLMSICYNIKNDKTKEFECLIKTFYYDTPRANICCKIGDIFLENSNYNIAIYWYKTATKCKCIIQKGGFVEDIYYNYYPYLQMCVCYYKLGDNKKAIYYNNKAGEYYKTDTIKQNKIFFKQLNNQK